VTLRIVISNQQELVPVDESRLRRTLLGILRDASVASGELSVAIVDDATMRPLNRQFLDHDYATDVLSFLLEREADRLEGEVIVSAETALRCAEQYTWTPENELLLYVIHGALHLVGYDDHGDEALGQMRDRERYYLAKLGLQPRYDGPTNPGGGTS
jgi:probable rRNA maturation factor